MSSRASPHLYVRFDGISTEFSCRPPDDRHFCFVPFSGSSAKLSEGGNAKGPSRRVSCQRPVALQMGSERAGKGGAGGGKCPGYEADSSLLGLFCLLRLVQCPEQNSGSRARMVGTSRNILIHFWLLHTLSVATPMEGASG